MEVRGLANRSERGWAGLGQGPFDKSEVLGWPGLANRSEGSGVGRPSTVWHGPITVQHSPTRSGTEHQPRSPQCCGTSYVSIWRKLVLVCSGISRIV